MQRESRRQAWGNRLIRAGGVGLIFSSLLKFLHPTPVVECMGSMGYEDGTFFLIAGVEFLIAVLLLVSRTDRLGLLLASAYLGGAVAAHVAIHRYETGGPFLVFMTTHPYVGVLVPGVFLTVLWFGTWLRQPEAVWRPRPGDDVRDENSDERRAGLSWTGVPNR